MAQEQIKLRNFIQEMAVAIPGDWEHRFTGTRSETVFNLQWEKVISIRKLDVARLKKKNTTYNFGFWDTVIMTTEEGGGTKSVFKIVGGASFKNIKIKGIRCRKILEVDTVGLEKEYQGKGFMTEFYTFLLENDICLVGGEKQFFGARKLWSRLSKSSSSKVDIINIKTKKILESDIVIHQGDTDSDIDKRLHSLYPNISQKDLRPLISQN